MMKLLLFYPSNLHFNFNFYIFALISKESIRHLTHSIMKVHA